MQGFGKMWQKTYRLTVPGDITPQQAIATWKAHFPEFWPKGNRFAGALTGISPGDVALLDLAIGGGVKLSTGVFVLYADEESFTLMTPQGHMFAGWITFSAERDAARHSRPGAGADAGQRPALRAGHDVRRAPEGRRVLGRDADRAGRATWARRRPGRPPGRVCVDSKRQWHNAGNVWHNSMIRSVLQTVAAPFTARRRRARHTS